MQRVRIRKMGLDVCVTIDVKLIHTTRSSGDLAEEVQRLDMARRAEFRGRRHEGPIAKEVAEALIAETQPQGPG